MSENEKQIGSIIKKLRKFRKKTQSQLSLDTGFSQNTISNHENNNRSIGLNEIKIYSKALGISEYIILKISEEYDKEGFSKTLENFEEFLKLYNFVSEAYYNDSDIYYYSYDTFDETVEIMNILKQANVDITNVTYDYVLDIYKQILSDDSNYSIKKYGNLADKEDLEKEKENIYNEIISFQHRYIELMLKKYESFEDKEKAYEESFELEKESIALSKKLKLTPNYQYDLIEGEPMSDTYEFKYPKRLQEFRNNLNLK